MRLRLLLLGERAPYRLLVRKHIEIDWPEAEIVEHCPGEDAPLEPQFSAAGFDAAVLVAAPPTLKSELLAAELLARREFAPIVFVLLDDAPAECSAVPGLRRLYGRKIDRAALKRLLTAAAGEQQRLQSLRRSHPDFSERYRFGSVSIRGHRCLRQVGSGGMCRIYLAESERTGTLVVLKVFNQVPDVSERLIGFDRFLQEYEIVAALKHRNIVRIHALGVADDHAYIAMEHFPAGDLRQRMKAPLSAAEALHCLEQIASALAAIHEVGVLHRDLKPANLMLRADGSLCLIDFGLAKATETPLELTGSREIFGTPYYMSPEQGHAEAIDARSDLYSLGVVLYEMLTGRKPYTGASAMEVIYKHKRAALPEIASEFAPYAGLLRRLLAKSPADRFQSAHELLHAIAELKACV
jgi:hypothetical protein